MSTWANINGFAWLGAGIFLWVNIHFIVGSLFFIGALFFFVLGWVMGD
jgi:hypothetical protein